MKTEPTKQDIKWAKLSWVMVIISLSLSLLFFVLKLM